MASCCTASKNWAFAVTTQTRVVDHRRAAVSRRQNHPAATLKVFAELFSKHVHEDPLHRAGLAGGLRMA